MLAGGHIPALLHPRNGKTTVVHVHDHVSMTVAVAVAAVAMIMVMMVVVMMVVVIDVTVSAYIAVLVGSAVVVVVVAWGGKVGKTGLGLTHVHASSGHVRRRGTRGGRGGST